MARGSAGSLSDQMSEIFREIKKEQEQQFQEAADKATKQAVKDIKAGAPIDQGEYRKGWRRRRLSNNRFVVYNEKKPGLTHLLENGHVIKNKNGRYGRAPAHKHIAPAEEKAVQQIIRDCSKSLK